VHIERLEGDGWVPFAGQSGEVQTMVEYPQGVPGIATTYAGQQEWKWTASFEAFDAAPARLGQIPDGTYRFVVDGAIRTAGATEPYHLESEGFAVTPWQGITLSDVTLADKDVSVVVDPIRYPRTYESPLRFVADSQPDGGICKQCSFRPWATTGTPRSIAVEVINPAGHVVRTVAATLVDGRWVADTNLAPAQHARIAAGAVRDTWGETNASIYEIASDGTVTSVSPTAAPAGEAGAPADPGAPGGPALPISSSHPLAVGIAALLALAVFILIARRITHTRSDSNEVQIP
jgi:hypothetical protein